MSNQDWRMSNPAPRLVGRAQTTGGLLQRLLAVKQRTRSTATRIAPSLSYGDSALWQTTRVDFKPVPGAA